MTTEEWIAYNQKKIQQLIKNCKPLEIAAKDTMAMQAQRIFMEGKDSADSSIGKYSTKPIYINPKNSPKKFATGGKGKEKTRIRKTYIAVGESSGYVERTKEKYISISKSKFKNGNPRKSRYFPGGYKEFRDKIGRETRFVNLSLTGDLQSDFANAGTISTTLKSVKPIKISSLEYVTALKRGINKEKRAGMEKKYGPIFQLTNEEIKNFFDVLAKENELYFGA